MRFCLAVDLGSEGDYTALSILKLVERFQGTQYNYKGVKRNADNSRTIIRELHLGHLERIPLGTPYQKVVDRISDIFFRPEFVEQIALVVDQNGIGLPVMQMMYDARLPPIGIFSHGGEAMNPSNRGFRVPKRDLVTSLMAAMQMKRLKMPSPEKLPIIKDLETELNNFRMKMTKSGNDTYEAFDQKIHDDLVMSLAMNVWWMDKIHGMQPTVKQNESEHYPE